MARAGAGRGAGAAHARRLGRLPGVLTRKRASAIVVRAKAWVYAASMAKQRKSPPAPQTTPPPALGPVVKEKAIPKMLTVQEAADAVNVSYATLMREIASGKLPSVKIGARRRIAQHDLWVYLNQQRTIAKPKEEGAEEEPPRPATAAERTLPLPHHEPSAAAQ